MPEPKFCLLNDRSPIQISGAGAKKFLQDLITSDVERVSGGNAIYGALLTPQGKILYDFFVAMIGGAFVIDAASDQAADLIKRLTFYKLRAAVDIVDLGHELAVAAMWDVPADVGEIDGGVIFADPRNADAGARLIAEQHTLEAFALKHNLQICDEDIYHRHRIELGLADSSRDIGTGELFPHECNFDLIGGVDFNKGCYVGQEVVSRTEHRGNARKRIVRLNIDGKPPPKGTDITAGDKAIGQMLSSSGTAALGLIRLDRLQTAQSQELPLTADGSTMTLEGSSLPQQREVGE